QNTRRASGIARSTRVKARTVSRSPTLARASSRQTFKPTATASGGGFGTWRPGTLQTTSSPCTIASRILVGRYSESGAYDPATLMTATARVAGAASSNVTNSSLDTVRAATTMWAPVSANDSAADRSDAPNGSSFSPSTRLSPMYWETVTLLRPTGSASFNICSSQSTPWTACAATPPTV